LADNRSGGDENLVFWRSADGLVWSEPELPVVDPNIRTSDWIFHDVIAIDGGFITAAVSSRDSSQLQFLASSDGLSWTDVGPAPAVMMRGLAWQGGLVVNGYAQEGDPNKTWYFPPPGDPILSPVTSTPPVSIDPRTATSEPAATAEPAVTAAPAVTPQPAGPTSTSGADG